MIIVSLLCPTGRSTNVVLPRTSCIQENNLFLCDVHVNNIVGNSCHYINVYTVQAEILGNIIFSSLLRKHCWRDFKLVDLITV